MNKRKLYLKDSASVDADKQVILVNKFRKSPSHDNKDFKPLVRKTRRRARILRVTADKAYDDESNHKVIREEIKAESIIPQGTSISPYGGVRGSTGKE